MYRSMDPLKMLFIELDRELAKNDVDQMKYLLRGEQLQESTLHKLDCARDIFAELEKQGYISESNLKLLLDLFGFLKRQPLKERVVEFLQSHGHRKRRTEAEVSIKVDFGEGYQINITKKVSEQQAWFLLNSTTNSRINCWDDVPTAKAHMEGIEGITCKRVEHSCLEFIVACATIQATERLWEEYQSGNLYEVFKKAVITDDMLETVGAKDIPITLQISEDEYTACRAAISSWRGVSVPYTAMDGKKGPGARPKTTSRNSTRRRQYKTVINFASGDPENENDQNSEIARHSAPGMRRDRRDRVGIAENYIQEKATNAKSTYWHSSGSYGTSKGDRQHRHPVDSTSMPYNRGVQGRNEMTTVGSRQEVEKTAQSDSLPVLQHKERILDEIRANRVTCIHGETGCGKSSMVPQFILDEKTPDDREKLKIIVTQPRRMAAITLARRVASQRNESVGLSVGYQIGGESKQAHFTKLIYVTTGFLLKKLVSNPKSFDDYSHVILDEIHERQIDSDLVSLVVKLSMDEYYSTKVIVMSATLQGELFSRYFCMPQEKPSNSSSDSDSDSESCSAAADQHVRDPIFVGARRFNVETIYIDQLVSEAEYMHWFSADNIQSLADAWVKFSQQSMLKNSSTDVQGQFSSLFGMTTMTDKKLNSLSSKLYGIENSKDKLKATILNGLYEVCVTLVKNMATPGESILVFLPGIGEIYTLCEYLYPFEFRPGKGQCPFKLFVLHSQIPREEQEECFEMPPKGRAHIILATNIAESSLTLPNVRVVIDFGLKRQISYDEKRRMSCLLSVWCSKASAQQRAGRTGRVFEGKVVRLMAENYFESCLQDFDPPEMMTSSLDKLVLRMKQLAKQIAPGMPTSELLSYAVEPPSMEKFDAAVESLAEVGALTKNSEHADITLLGYVALQLPVDMGLSRLVVYGVLFNCTCDAVVMAAALSLRMDPFSLPSIMVMKDPHKFWPSLEKSFKARAQFDNGQYSEPLMYVNMFKAWLKEREKDNRKSALYKSRQRFCARNALIMERLAEMESSVCEIASRLHRYLQSDSKACKDIAYLLSLLKSEIADSDDDSLDDGKGSGKGQDKQKQEKGKTKSPAKTNSAGQQKILAKTSGKMDGKSASENGHLSREAGPSTSQKNDIATPVDKLFSSDTMLLKMLQVAAFNPCYLVGRHDWPPPDGRERLFNRTEREEQNIKSLCYDPACTIILNNMNPILCREDKKKVLSQILDLMCTPKRFEFGSGRFSDRVFIEFEKCPALDSSNPVIHDLPLRAHTLNQYGCDRSQFSFPLTKEMASVIKLPQIEFKKPCQPYRIIWHLLVNDSTVKQLSCFLNGWRNPIGYACETRKIKHHAVAATVQGTDDNSKCRVDGVTVLPTDCHGVLAVVMLMTFLPARFDCKLTIKRNRIRHVDLLNHKFDIPKNVPISGMILVAMDEIRHHLSELFITTNDFCKIPESDLDVSIKHLIKLVSSIESSDDTALSEGSSTKVHISVYEGQKIQAHSNNEGCHTESSERHTESVQVNGDDHEFAFLKPFNLQNIGKHLGFEVEEVKKKLNQLYYEFRRRLDEQ